MDINDYNLFDLRRILLGASPAEFLFESVIRTTVMYAFLLIMLRLLGKRMNSQATIAELAVMLMLGAIIAMPIESADRGIIPGMLLMLTVLILQRSSAMFALSAGSVPRIMASQVSALVVDGELQLEALSKERITREQLFSKLRQQNISNLGEVERLYLESNGGFSLYKFDQAKPGLCTFPNSDVSDLCTSRIVPTVRACCICGKTSLNELNQPCSCSSQNWAQAIS